MSKLVIVESPTKVRTLGRILDSSYKIKASMGHVRDLLKSKLSVDVEKDFKPRYRILHEKGDVVKELRQAVKGANEVYLATDPDREGEAIAWHLTFAARIPNEKTRRVAFHELTPPTIKAAFAHPREIDMDLVNAQQARRILDRLVGYKISPLLWKKVKGGLSAGRVQSVALRMVVEREREIEAFEPQEYWTIAAELAKRRGDTSPFTAELVKISGEKLDKQLKCEEEAQAVVGALSEAAYRVKKVKRRKRRRAPSPPFKTSTLQRKAGSKLGFSPKRTMFLAQQLYEGIKLGEEGEVGLITYMRTDSVYVAPAAQKEARRYIWEEYGEEFVPKVPPKYKAKRSQEGHECIRPTSVFRAPGRIKRYLDRDQFLLYKLIWDRFTSSQMSSAILDQTIAMILADEEYLFQAKGEEMIFSGFLVLYPEALKEQKERQVLPPLFEGEQLDLLKLIPEQHFTKPPPHFDESSLVAAMERAGVGRPSTYAPTISIIQKRYYVEKENGHLVPTKLGFTVCDLLCQHFPEIMDVDFTARMGEKLDEVAAGEMEWVGMLHEFWGPFKETLDKAKANMEGVELVKPIGERCPKCGEELVVKWGRYGKFIGCSNFPKCKFTRPYLEKIGVKCPKCGGDLVERRTRKGKTFYGCSSYPDCDFATWDRPIREPCPECGWLMVEKGDYLECTKCGKRIER